ncbi:MAG: hypothetical protein JXM70_08680, partial [Pirellulales bacterium]|nr:hypothetical protein [Pirellulales bacterium]
SQPETWSVSQSLGPAPPVKDLPPIEVLPDHQRLQPILLLGIGGTGARVLRKLRGRINDRYGNIDIPSIKMMMIDTDPNTISDAMAGDPHTALAAEETLVLSLRRPQQYRSNAQKHLSWLSRRWLYNIPRSLKTKGLRPLGRLALIDHAPVVLERLRENLSDVTARDALAASAKALGVAAGDRTPRVYIVASISGGTGSGMVLDVAAMTRKILEELGFSDERLLGMLTHSTSRRPEEHDMAVANAYACLGELHHYHRTKSYPCHTACQLSVTDKYTSIFRHTYMIPLGEQMDEQQFDNATDAIAQYLYLDAVTPAGVFFDSHRASEENTCDDPTDSVHLRTFGMTQVGCSAGDLPAIATDAVCRKVVALWQGDNSSVDSETEQAACQLADKQQIDLHAYVSQALDVVSREFGENPKTSLCTPDAEHNDGASSAWMLLHNTLDKLVSKRSFDPGHEDVSDRLGTALERSLNEMAARQGSAVSEWILKWANESLSGVASARSANELFTKRMQDMEFDIRQLLSTVGTQIDQLQTLIKKSGTPNPAEEKSSRGWKLFKKQPAPGEQLRLQYWRLRIARMILDKVVDALRVVRQHTVVAGDRLGDLSHVLNQLADQFPQDRSPEKLAAGDNIRTAETESPQQAIAREVYSQINSLAADVDRQLRVGLLAEHGLREILGEHESLQHLTAGLRNNSRAAVMQALKQLGVVRLMLDPEEDHHDVSGQLSIAEQHAQPALIACGGGRRLLVVRPDGESINIPTTNENSANLTPSIVTDSDSNLTICQEMTGLSARRAAVMLIDCRPDYEQVASRLHTRIDVDWTNFDLS